MCSYVVLYVYMEVMLGLFEEWYVVGEVVECDVEFEFDEDFV